MSKERLVKIGAACRQAESGNIIIGCFAASLVGESYSFSKEMFESVFRSYSDLELGKKFTAWVMEKEL